MSVALLVLKALASKQGVGIMTKRGAAAQMTATDGKRQAGIVKALGLVKQEPIQDESPVPFQAAPVSEASSSQAATAVSEASSASPIAASPGASEPVPTKRRKKEETHKEKLLEAGGTSGFDLRSETGKLWYEALKETPGLAEDYRKVGKRYQDQRLFRERWASQKAEALKHERLQKQQQIDEVYEDGEYMTLARPERRWPTCFYLDLQT